MKYIIIIIIITCSTMYYHSYL